MTTPDRQTHWDHVYATKPDDSVSWFEPSPTLSLDLIHACGLPRGSAVIDVGGGAARLVDALVREGFDASVLDVSAEALTLAKARLGPAASTVDWITADVTAWRPQRRYDLWHDRAVFHFLTAAHDRAAYVATLTAALAPGGWAVIGTFAPDGPERCSGLPVQRYSGETLAAALGAAFTLVETRPHAHHTPGGAVQRFQFSRLRRVA